MPKFIYWQYQWDLIKTDRYQLNIIRNLESKRVLNTNRLIDNPIEIEINRCKFIPEIQLPSGVGSDGSVSLNNGKSVIWE